MGRGMGGFGERLMVVGGGLDEVLHIGKLLDGCGWDRDRGWAWLAARSKRGSFLGTEVLCMLGIVLVL